MIVRILGQGQLAIDYCLVCYGVPGTPSGTWY